MRVGIFGGAFDPPHRGHEKAAKTFLTSAGLDLLYVIPSGDPPHKALSSGSKGVDRLRMCALSFLPLSEKIRVSDMEICSKEKSYTYLTVEKIKKAHPEDEIFLFVGTDQFLAFETWRNFEKLLASCTLCVMDRFEDREVLLKKKESLEKDFGARCLIFEEKPYIISSTRIREEIGEKGFSVALSPKVNDDILENDLYGSLSCAERKKAVKRARETLSKDRLSHTFSVMRECVLLGEIFSLSEEEKKNLSLAALYHDLTKEWTPEEQKKFLEKRGEKVSEDEISSPAVLHGRSAAILFREEMGPSPEYESAIFYHTTGKKEMTLKEKILFFADFIEETRRHKVCLTMREYFYSHLPEKKEERETFLDHCIIKVLQQTISHLKEKKFPIHPLTAFALEDLKEKTERKGL